MVLGLGQGHVKVVPELVDSPARKAELRSGQRREADAAFLQHRGDEQVELLLQVLGVQPLDLAPEVGQLGVVARANLFQRRLPLVDVALQQRGQVGCLGGRRIGCTHGHLFFGDLRLGYSSNIRSARMSVLVLLRRPTRSTAGRRSAGGAVSPAITCRAPLAIVPG